MKRFALIGNPNCGKTTLFNGLTGSNAHVGTWPGVTADSREGICKKGKESVTIVDLPGIYSLSPYTPEEIVSRNYILDEKPDCVINIIDATNLERNLYLTTQVMEIDVPIIIALNMIDEVERAGDKIDVKKLEEKLNLPVVAISALKENGIVELIDRAIETSEKRRRGTSVLFESKIGHLIRDVRIALEGQGVENPLFHAVKLVELDEIEVKMHQTTTKMVEEFKSVFADELFGSDFEALIADGRYKYITSNYSLAVSKKRADVSALTKSDKIDKVLTHKIWGIPLFLGILLAIFHLTFSENFLFLGGLIKDSAVSFEGSKYFEGLFYDGAINSPGVILQNFVVGITDFLTATIERAMDGSAEWAKGLVCDGILGGIFAVISFIPQILLLLLFFAILEDSGYMARVAFILDKIFRRFGLSGRAFMPMIMGFGCSVPAMINTRTLSDEEERIATLRVIPFFSCGAKLPILTAIAGGIVMRFGVGNADLITYGMYLLGVVTAIVSVIVMRETTMRGDIPSFIMELPTYRRPQAKSLMHLLFDKAKHFIEKAFTIILASTIVIWFVSHFTFDWKYLVDERMDESILAGIGKLIQPLATPMGFGSQLKGMGWVFVVTAITGLIAKENVIATLSTLAACLIVGFEGDEEGVRSVVIMIEQTGITIPALISFIVFNMTTIPCFAAVATAKAEFKGNKKRFNLTLLFWIGTSYFVSTMVYLVGTFVWTIAIFLAIFIGFFTFVYFRNKREKLAKLGKK